MLPPDNEAPVAVSDSFRVNEDQPLILDAADLLENDSDDGNSLEVKEVQNAINGTVRLVGDRITFTPDADFNGTASFEYTISDGALTDNALVSISVTPIDDAPRAANDTLTTNEDTPLSVLQAVLLLNDTEVDGQNLTLTEVFNAQNGSVALVGADVVFTPDPNFNGVASFDYTVSDGVLTDTATVTVTVNAVNDAPLAADDNASTDEDTDLILDTSALLANDTDIDLDILTITSVQNEQNGSAVLAGNQITFTPDPDFFGEASFEYTVEDGNGGSDIGFVAITVNPVNDAPIANPDTVETDEDVALVIPAEDLLANDIDADNDILLVIDATDPTNGAVVFDDVANTITFTPDSGFSGDASFLYTITDGQAFAFVLVTVIVNAVNDAPVAVDDTAFTDEDVALNIPAATLLANDSDLDNDPLFVASVQNAQNGSAVLAGNQITFTPDPNFFGTASFEYTVSDGDLTDTALVTVTVNSVNDAPVAVDDSASTDEDTALVIAAATLLDNDLDVDGDNLTIVSVQNAQNGNAVLNGANITFTPNANFNDTASFTYTVEDGNGGSDTALVTVTVNPVNDAPVAGDDAVSTSEDAPLVIAAASLLANDNDPDGDNLTIVSVQNAQNGNAVLNGANITFTPNANFNGTASFEYTVSDGDLTDTALVTVTVNAVNDAPVADNQSLTTNEDTPLNITLTANDIDSSNLSFAVVTGPANGALSGTAPNLVYTPDADFNGTDSFTFVANDGDLDSNTATVSITVNAVNDAPVAVDDSVSTDEDTPLLLDGSELVVNDSDVDNDALFVVSVQNAQNGSAVLAGNQITFTPDPDFFGEASFEYTVSDGSLTDVGLVFVTVNPVNECGDGELDDGEECDDGNDQNGDGCENDCTLTPDIVQVSAGNSHTCALFDTGNVRCWGFNNFGQLGYGNTNNIGDDETPADAGDVNVGGFVIQITTGANHTCALLDTGSIRCWGFNNKGQLGYGNTEDIGDDETPASAGDVNLGGSAIQIAAGANHTCALLDTGNVRCWGDGNFGQLGYGNTNNIGDDETPADAGDINVGGSVTQITAGFAHTCALLDTDNVRCWGDSSVGQLGYGNTDDIGDDETPADAGDINVGGSVIQITAGEGHTCALLDTGSIRCWGSGNSGQLGYGNTNNIGDDEEPADAGDVNLGGSATQIAAGKNRTCALLNTGNVRCWGDGNFGQLGYGNTNSIGDDEDPASAGDVNVGGSVTQIATGDLHTCALLDSGSIRCWGLGLSGRLGYGNTDDIGDNEDPADAGDVPVF